MLLKRLIWIGILGGATTIFATSSTWTTTSNTPLSAPVSWNNGTVPTEVATFDSNVTNVYPQPNDSSGTSFNIEQLYFPNSADYFSFTFLNTPLIFTGAANVGIIGAKTNTSLFLYNQFGYQSIVAQLELNGTTSNTLGSADTLIFNEGINSEVEYQLYSPSGTVEIGDNGTLSCDNSASLGNTGSAFIGGWVKGGQLVVNNLSVGEEAVINISNYGTAIGAAVGTAILGLVGNPGTTGYGQLSVLGNLTMDNNVVINVSNFGLCDRGDFGCLFGYVEAAGLGVEAAQMSANSVLGGNNISINLSNKGKLTALGSLYFIGYHGSSQQLNFSSCAVGDNFLLNIENEGECNQLIQPSPFPFNFINYVGKNVIGDFKAGNNASINISNNNKMIISGGEGFATGISPGFSLGNVNLGNNGSLTISNNGNLQGSGTANDTGIQGFPCEILSLTAGDNLAINITNNGSYTGPGSTNFSGIMGGIGNLNVITGQLVSSGPFTVGDNTIISLSNSGSYAGTGSSNLIGLIGGYQLAMEAPFLAGKNLVMTASNILGSVQGEPLNQEKFSLQAKNLDRASLLSRFQAPNDLQSVEQAIAKFPSLGNLLKRASNHLMGSKIDANRNLNLMGSDPNGNFVGCVTGSQIYFKDICTLGDGSIITAFNSGTVGVGTLDQDGAQIYFANGFIINGKATFKAVNSTLAPSPLPLGIVVADSPTSQGGDVNITLENSSFNVNFSSHPITIGALNGDSLSFVNSKASLVIDMDANVMADFQGNIQSAPLLLKKGSGTQKLSGVSSFTDLTTVANGTLNLSGTLPGDIHINPKGTLEGTGVSFGYLTNDGIVAPGDKTGILSVGNYAETSRATLFINALNAKPTHWGKLVVSNQAVLAGHLVLNILPGASFKAGQELVVLSSGNNIKGAFSNFTAKNLPEGLTAELIARPTQIIVRFSKTEKPLPPEPPRGLKVERIKSTCHSHIDYINQLSWKPSHSREVVSYLIYRNGKEIATIPADKKLVYEDQNQDLRSEVSYKVFAVDKAGQRSKPAVFVLKACVVDKCIKCLKTID